MRGNARRPAILRSRRSAVSRQVGTRAGLDHALSQADTRGSITEQCAHFDADIAILASAAYIASFFSGLVAPKGRVVGIPYYVREAG